MFHDSHMETMRIIIYSCVKLGKSETYQNAAAYGQIFLSNQQRIYTDFPLQWVCQRYAQQYPLFAAPSAHLLHQSGKIIRKTRLI